MASATARGTCVPAAPSQKMRASCSAGNWGRTPSARAGGSSRNLRAGKLRESENHRFV